MAPCVRGVGRWAACAVSAALLLAAIDGTASAQPVTFEGKTYVNKGLVGVGRVPSNAKDQLGETLGGLGSSIALDLASWTKNSNGSYSGVLYMLPDRGWNTLGTLDFKGRLQKFHINFTPFEGAQTGNQNQLKLGYRKAIQFHEADGTPTTGLDATKVLPKTDEFPKLPAGYRTDRLSVDNEGVVNVGDGTFWISDEYGPYVYHYTANGKLIEVIRPPQAFIPKRLNKNGKPVDDFSANSPPIGVTYDPSPGNPVSGRQNNQGLEGLAMSPDRTKLFVLLQSALIQDLDISSTKTTRRNTRLLTYDVTQSPASLTAEYVVQLPVFQDPSTSQPQLLIAAQSELHALNNHQFLVLARDSGAGFGLGNSTSVYRSIDLIDTTGATNIAHTKYDQPKNPVAPNGVLKPGIVPVKYQKFLDINDNKQLNRFGLHNGEPNNANNLSEKWEGLAIAPVFDPENPNDYFLFVSNDNDFITKDGFMVGQPYSDASGKNVDSMVLVYRVKLPGYKPPRLPH